LGIVVRSASPVIQQETIIKKGGGEKLGMKHGRGNKNQHEGFKDSGKLLAKRGKKLKNKITREINRTSQKKEKGKDFEQDRSQEKKGKIECRGGGLSLEKASLAFKPGEREPK